MDRSIGARPLHNFCDSCRGYWHGTFREAIRNDLRYIVTSVCRSFLLRKQSLLELVSSSLFVHLCSFLLTLLMPIFYRQQRMSRRATMCSSTSLSAFNSSSSALGFIPRFH